MLSKSISAASASIRDADDLPEVEANPATLIELVVNLVENSIRYRVAERPLEIEICVEVERDLFIFQVRDNGQGVPEAHHDRVLTCLPGSTQGTTSPEAGSALPFVGRSSSGRAR